MEYVRLGNTGMKVSRLCLGCMTYGSSKWRKWILDEKASRPFFKQALEAGINFFTRRICILLARASKSPARR